MAAFLLVSLEQIKAKQQEGFPPEKKLGIHITKGSLTRAAAARQKLLVSLGPPADCIDVAHGQADLDGHRILSLRVEVWFGS